MGGGTRVQTNKLEDSQAWFVISALALDKHAVEGKDGFTVAVVPNLWTKDQDGADDPEALKSSRRDCICWEFVGAASTGLDSSNPN